MFNAVMPAAFQDVREADEIAVYVGLRILDRVPDACLRRKMDDALGTMLSKNLRCAGAIGHVRPDIRVTGIRRPRKAFQARLLELDIIVRVETIEADDLVAA